MLVTGIVTEWKEQGFWITQIQKDFQNNKYTIEMTNGKNDVVFIPISQMEYEEIVHEAMSEPRITGEKDNEYA